MKKSLVALLSTLTFVACSQAPTFDPATIADADGQIRRVEPLSWWVGMKTPLQLLIGGENISEYSLDIEGGKGVSLKAIHKADNPNYIFADIEIDDNAECGTYYLVFTRGDEQFKYPYQIEQRREGSADRKSFTTADVIYLLMPDRFANGDPSNDSTPCTIEKAARNEFFGRHGGDLQGMIDNLDYIASLGATTIWPTPLLLDNEPHETYHGYACADYYHIDPRFGDNALYREFVAKAHEKDLKVIMDVVTNHCGVAHWWMTDMPFNDWVHVFPEYTGTNVCFSTNMDPNASKYDLNLQESGWFVPSMPDMNLNNPFVLQYFKQWAVWWIEYADLDGFRVDTYPYNEKEPMSEWCASIRNEYPSINIVGECWTSSIPQLAYWQGGNDNKDGFDTNLPAIMDFPLQEAICHALSCDNPGWGQGMTRVYDCLSHDFVYHDLSNMMIFAGNHDMGRIGDVVRKNPKRAKLAMTLMATMRGIPQIFYGDEMMFCSKDLSQGHGGLRVDFPGGWADDKVNLFTVEGRKGMHKELFDHAQRLLQWRKTKSVIHDGMTKHFMTRDNTYAYFRYNDTEAVFVYINNSGEAKQIPWANYNEIGASLHNGRNVLTGEAVTVDNNTVVAPHEALVVEFNR
ncbi:MAG: glycoside hydrolase family 13 protein [Alistipes sp.]|nr:glycoside hydrolase family 13 protein [Alistipes sp.]